MPLKVSDGIGAWIKDFKKSDAPQFKGKSEEERREMAIAAYLDAKRGPQKEDVNEKRLMKGIEVDDDTLRMFKANPRMVPNSPAFRRLDPKTQKAVKKHLGMREDVELEENKARQSADLAKAMAAFKKRGGKVKKVAPGKAAGYHGKDDPGAGVHGMMDRPDTKGMPRRKKVRSLRAGVEESFDEAKEPSMNQVMAVMAPTKNAEEGVAAIMRVFKVDKNKAMKLLDAAIKDVLGESIDETNLNELSIMTLNRYYKKALSAIHKSRKSHDASIMRGMDPSKDKATISKRAKGVNLAKSRALKKVRGESVNEEMMFKVSVEGLPPMIMLGRSPGDIKGQLRKIVKQPSMITDVERMTKADVRKRYRDMAKGDGDEEA